MRTALKCAMLGGRWVEKDSWSGLTRFLVVKKQFGDVYTCKWKEIEKHTTSMQSALSSPAPKSSGVEETKKAQEVQEAKKATEEKPKKKKKKAKETAETNPNEEEEEKKNGKQRSAKDQEMALKLKEALRVKANLTKVEFLGRQTRCVCVFVPL